MFWPTTRTVPGRQPFAIGGGLLVDRRSEGEPGRLDFREVLDRRFVLAAIHEYRLALRWLVYATSEALVQISWVHRFGRHFARSQAPPALTAADPARNLIGHF